MPLTSPAALHRRAVLAAALALPLATRAEASPAPVVPPGGRLAFRAVRNGSPLGTHVLTFRAEGNALSVAIAVDYQVKFGPITMYRYRLRANEIWRDGILQTVNSSTDDNGTTEFMNAEREGDRLRVEGSKCGRYLAPPGALPSSHWNRRELDTVMINAQDGALLPFQVNKLGAAPVRATNGTVINANRYALTGPAMLDLWYTENDIWTGLRAVAKDGSVVTYEPDLG
jgi:hypothetical protein